MDDKDAERRKREPENARNSESTKRACHEVVFHLEETHIEKRKNDVDRDCGISTGCDPKAFKAVASRISNENVFLIQELGFGPVRQFRCSELNLSLCKMLLDNFNVEKCTIKIHGRNLTVMEKDFDRLMGLRCRGTEVSLPKRVIHDPEVADLQGIIWGVDKEMSIDILRKNVVFSDDPDNLFVVSFVLFALAIMYCPTRAGYVDPRLLLLVKDRKRMRSYNWGRLAFRKLLEEVKLYQNNKPDHVGGCLVFLQLFYLSVIGEKMFIIPKSVPPVMTWGRKESNMIYERVEEKGGFYKTDGIWVTKRYSSVRSTEFSGSRDYSTGLKTNLVDDMSAMRSHISTAEEKVGVLVNTMYRIGPDISNLREAMTLLHDSMVKLKSGDVTGLVDEVFRAVRSIEGGNVHPGEVSDYSGFEKNQCTREEDVNAYISKPIGPNSDAKGSQPFNGSGEAKKQRRRKFGTVAKLSPSDMDILKYLSSKKGHAKDNLGSVEVGRFRGFSVSRWDLQCLSPTRSISSEVINIMGEYCFVNREDWWFLSTLFSERAKDYYDSYAGVQSYVSATISMCRLRKYCGRLKACKKIFIPILDDVVDHWFLVVANITEGECEMWDCIPDLPAQQRRKNMVNNVMSLLGEVFSSELEVSDVAPSALSSYSFAYPESSRIVPNKYDSGIFTIRHIQYYRERWFSVFNSADERIRIALEIVNNPMNECYKSVWDSVCREENEISECKELPATSGDVVGDHADPVTTTSGMKLKPRVPRR
ncbi:hypothetical protein ACLB2K_042480 [Fragaria x ananassa]